MYFFVAELSGNDINFIKFPGQPSADSGWNGGVFK
jgi:hypothetical protein